MIIHFAWLMYLLFTGVNLSSIVSFQGKDSSDWRCDRAPPGEKSQENYIEWLHKYICCEHLFRLTRCPWSLGWIPSRARGPEASETPRRSWITVPRRASNPTPSWYAIHEKLFQLPKDIKFHTIFIPHQIDWTKIDAVYDELSGGSDKVVRYVLDCDKGF